MELTLEQQRAVALARARQRAAEKNDWEGSSNQAKEEFSIGKTLSNVPGSAAQFGKGLYEFGRSLVTEPGKTGMGIMDILAGGLRNIAPQAVQEAASAIDPNPEAAERASQTANAVGEFYSKRYGGLENIKRTVQGDPVGAAADLSAVLSLGSGAARLLGTTAGAFQKTAGMAPTLNAVGSNLGTVASATNPLSVLKPVGKVAGEVLRQGLGLTTGVGPENISQAYKAGKELNKDFLQNIKGDVSANEVLERARQGLQTMRANRSGLYQQDIAATRANTTPIDFTPIDKKLAGVVDSMKEGKHWKIGAEEIKDIKKLESAVREWRIDPQSHTAIGLDALKQRLDALYPSSETHAQAQRAITSVRNEVKNLIVKQSPEYAQTMRNYESALEIERDITKALSIGDKAAKDTAIRKLQSLARNNVNTNYGNRLDLAKTLETEGGVDLMPSISGQAMNSWAPRGLVGHGGVLGASYAALAGSPKALALVPLQSPKAVGLGTYGLGAGAGLLGRGAGAVGLTPDRARLGGLFGYELSRPELEQ